jgi:hypothetical protein
MDQNILTLTRVTKDMGSTLKPGPMVVAGPDQTMTDELLDDLGTAGDSGLNMAMLADLVAAMSVHENMGVNLYRTLQTITVNPMLRSAYADFEQDAIDAVAIHAGLMETLGIPMHYISPAARLTEGMDSHMIMSFLEAGSGDQLTIDMKTVEATFLASSMCVANTELLRKIGEEAEGEAAAAIEQAVLQLEGPQTEHLAWAQQNRERMALMLVKHPITHKVMEWTENTIAKVTGKAPKS